MIKIHFSVLDVMELREDYPSRVDLILLQSTVAFDGGEID